MSPKKTTAKKSVKSPMQMTAEQEALLQLNSLIKQINQNVANMQAWMRVTQDMLLGSARLAGLDPVAFAKAIDESERNQSFELEVVTELKKIRAIAEKRKNAAAAKRAVDSPVVKIKKGK